MEFLNTTNQDQRDLMQGVSNASFALRKEEREHLAMLIADRVLIGLGFKKV